MYNTYFKIFLFNLKIIEITNKSIFLDYKLFQLSLKSSIIMSCDMFSLIEVVISSY